MEGGLGEFSGSEVHDTHPEGKDKTQGLPPEPDPLRASDVLGQRGKAAMQGRPEEPGGQQQPGRSEFFDVTEKPPATEGLTSKGIGAMQGTAGEEK